MSSSCTSAERFISFYIVPAICTIGIIGNIVNLIVFTRQRMREIVFVYLTALAVFDLLVVLVGLPVGFVRCGERPVWKTNNNTALPYQFMPAQSTTAPSSLTTLSADDLLFMTNSSSTEADDVRRPQVMFDNFTRTESATAAEYPTTTTTYDGNNMIVVVNVDSFDEYDANEREKTDEAVSSSFAELFSATNPAQFSLSKAALTSPVPPIISPAPAAVGAQRLTKYAVIFYEFYLLRGLGNFSIYAAIFVTLAMTAERYWTIRRALKQLTLPTSSKVRATVILSTVVGFSLLLTIPRYFMWHIVTMSVVEQPSLADVSATPFDQRSAQNYNNDGRAIVTTTYSIKIKDSISPILIDVYEFLSICIHFLEIFILFTLNTALIIILRRRRRKHEELTSGNTDASTLLTKTESRRRRFAGSSSSVNRQSHNGGNSSSGKRRSTTTSSRASSSAANSMRNGGGTSSSHILRRESDSWRNNIIVKALLNRTGASDNNNRSASIINQNSFNSHQQQQHRPSISINEASTFQQSVVYDDEQPSTVESIALMPTTTTTTPLMVLNNHNDDIIQHRYRRRSLTKKNSGPIQSSSTTDDDEFANNNITNDSSNSSVENSKAIGRYKDRKPTSSSTAAPGSKRVKLIRLESSASVKQQEVVDENPVIIVDGADSTPSSYRPYQQQQQQQRISTGSRPSSTKVMVRQNSSPAPKTRRHQRPLHQPSMHRAHSHDAPDHDAAAAAAPSPIVGAPLSARHVRNASWSAGKLSIVSGTSSSAMMARGASLKHQHTIGAYSTTSAVSQSSSSANTTRDDVTRMLVYLIVLHLVCHFLSPITASSVAKTLFGKEYVASDTYRFQVLINNLLNLINNSMNFFVYITTSKRYRRELSAMYRGA